MKPISAGNFTKLSEVRSAAARCQACPLYRKATQTVFGRGPVGAALMIVGEQPGDQEDLAGKPFVGPAGRLLDAAIAEAGLARESIYLTNAVKHFKWKPARKRRLHQKPNASEVEACRPWLDLEIAMVKPTVVLALGATAAQALMGRDFRVTVSRAKIFRVPWAAAFVATVHPSSVLRAPAADRPEQEAEFKRDVARVASLLRGRAGSSGGEAAL